MSKSVAYIKVTCDKCKTNTVEVCLKDTGLGWDDGRLDTDLKRIYNWYTQMMIGKDVCPECQESLLPEKRRTE